MVTALQTSQVHALTKLDASILNHKQVSAKYIFCLLYTSDAADE